MSLDPPISDAELIRRYEAQTGRTLNGTLNGIALGAGSPLLDAPAPRKTAGNARANEHAHRETEHDIQVALFRRIRDPEEVRRRPALAKVYAVPNGGFRTIGQAKRLRAEGVEPGVPDIDCPVARGGWFGLRLEMKRPGGTISPSQADRLASLEADGYRVAVHETADGAWLELVAYLDLPPTVPTTPPSQ